MGTKRNPGKFDCYSKADPDEPMFTLLARDPAAQHLVLAWAFLRIGAITDARNMMQEAFNMLKSSGKPLLDPDSEKIAEARHVAMTMRAWEVARMIGKIEEPEADEELKNVLKERDCVLVKIPDNCPHEILITDTTAAKIEDKGSFMADIRITCQQCGTAFKFLGLKTGLDMAGAAVSFDHTEGRFAIVPVGSKPPEFKPGDARGFGISFKKLK